MASTFGIQTGPLTAVKNYSDDAKVQLTLVEFGMAMGIFEEAMGNQEKLDAVVVHLEAYILDRVWRHRMMVAEQAAEADAKANYNLE